MASPSTSDVVQKVRRAGVVGAGGAGFPTYVKLQSRVDTYICNAAECEPLLFKDQELMKHFAGRVLDGMRAAMRQTGASRGVVAIKKKYKDAIAALQEHLHGDIELYLYDSFYPAGDEYIIVYDVTGRLIPPGGIPLQVGCAVNNVETLINVSRALEGTPVTHTALTVAGMVARPVSAVVPLGVTARDVLELAGGPTCDDPALLDGGAMMGKVLLDLDTPVTRTSGGYIVLPRDHKLIRRKTAPEDTKVHISRSACDQCSFCTEFCPRYLLGYAIEPHKVMRSVGFEGERELRWGQLGLLCCECSVCDLYACPEDLPPKDMCVRSKRLFREANLKPEPLVGLGRAHPMRDSRRIPLDRLIERLGLTRWNVHAPMVAQVPEPARVKLMLKQHIGAAAAPVVRVGDGVAAGQIVADVRPDQLGVPIHSSIAGRVTAIDETSITVSR